LQTAHEKFCNERRPAQLRLSLAARRLKAQRRQGHRTGLGLFGADPKTVASTSILQVLNVLMGGSLRRSNVAPAAITRAIEGDGAALRACKDRVAPRLRHRALDFALPDLAAVEHDKHAGAPAAQADEDDASEGQSLADFLAARTGLMGPRASGENV
jgi:hypothetical protein